MRVAGMAMLRVVTVRVIVLGVMCAIVMTVVCAGSHVSISSASSPCPVL